MGGQMGSKAIQRTAGHSKKIHKNKRERKEDMKWKERKLTSKKKLFIHQQMLNDFVFFVMDIKSALF